MESGLGPTILRRPSKHSYLLQLTTQLVTGLGGKRGWDRATSDVDTAVTLASAQALFELDQHRPCIVASCVARWGWKPIDLLVLAKRQSAPDIDRPSRKHVCDRSSCISGVDGAVSLLTQSWHRRCNERGSKLGLYLPRPRPRSRPRPRPGPRPSWA